MNCGYFSSELLTGNIGERKFIFTGSENDCTTEANSGMRNMCDAAQYTTAPARSAKPPCTNTPRNVCMFTHCAAICNAPYTVAAMHAAARLILNSEGTMRELSKFSTRSMSAQYNAKRFITLAHENASGRARMGACARSEILNTAPTTRANSPPSVIK